VKLPPYGVVVLGFLLVSSGVGVALAVHLPYGVAGALGLLYVPIVLYRLPLAIALWVPMVFLEGVAAMNTASKAAGLLLSAVWLVSVFTRRSANTVGVLERNRGLLWIFAAFLAWLTLSATWASNQSDALSYVWHWWAVAVLFLLVSTSLPTLRAIQLVLIGMLAGAVASVMVGLAHGSLTQLTSASATDRLIGGAGDPNVLAAGLVPAAVIAFSLMVPLRKAIWRWILMAAVGVLVVGLVASQSRGGFVAAAVAAVMTLVLFRRQRRTLLGTMLPAVGALIVMFVMFPSTWHRVTNYSDGGNGRTELWTIAWRMTEAHPVLGVGLNNYSVQAPRYVSEPGELKYVRIVTTLNPVVHNIYLQLLAEDGFIGLGLFLAIAARCLQSAWQAARRFDARGDPAGGALARGVLVGQIGILVAGVFLSAGFDTRLWILFGLGLALRRASESDAVVPAYQNAAPLLETPLLAIDRAR
jgi:O-antigen ligase